MHEKEETEILLNEELIESCEYNSCRNEYYKGITELNVVIINNDSVYEEYSNSITFNHQMENTSYDENLHARQNGSINENRLAKEALEYQNYFDSTDGSSISRHRTNTYDQTHYRPNSINPQAISADDERICQCINLCGLTSLENTSDAKFEIAKEKIHCFYHKEVRGIGKNILSSSFTLRVYQWILWIIIIVQIYMFYALLKKRAFKM